MLFVIVQFTTFEDWAYVSQIIALSLLVNTYLARLLPQIEAIVLIVHIIGFFGILIPLVFTAPKGSASDVFDTFINSGAWATDGLAFFVGSIQAMFAFTGKCVLCQN